MSKTSLTFLILLLSLSFNTTAQKSPVDYVWKGDEDEGQMGGWFVIASMGLFEMNGGVTDEPVFDLTSPLFDEITIHIDKMYNEGKSFVIKTINNSAENVYIQSATFNGIPLTVPKLKFKEVVKGGELVFIMGNRPNTSWGLNTK